MPADARDAISISLADADAPDAPPWKRALAERLRAGPNAEQAAHLASDVLEAAGSGLLARLEEDADAAETLARLLAGLCGTAPFFAPLLRRHPAWISALLDEDFSRPRSREDLERCWAAGVGGSSSDPMQRLRYFKYYELARITARDACREWLPLEHSDDTLRETSALADELLGQALRIAAAEIASLNGPPHWSDEAGQTIELGLSVLGLGKLGAGELNYSSDVDLIYVHGTPTDGIVHDGPSGLSPVQYFTKVAQRFGRIVSERTADGFLYRVDLDLRPEGAQGLLVISDAALEQYYESWAETWEKAAFMKARPVAGDLELGWRTIRAMAPMLYRSAMDFSAVSGIRELKNKIEESRSRRDDGFDVKVGVGGIRDIEFVAQALQLLHGGRIPQLRERSTARTLEQIGALGLMPADETAALANAYRFLRRLENRLQMEGERQTHLLGAGEAQQRRAALSLGYGTGNDGIESFAADLARHRARARASFQALLPESGPERIVELFELSASQLFSFPTTRRMLGNLAEHFAREVDARADPERALNNLSRFVAGLGQNRFYYDLLLDRPELVPRLTALFDASNYLSSILASHPRLIEPLFSDPDVLLLDRKDLEEDLRALSVPRGDAPSQRDPVEDALEALRLFHHRQVLNIGLLDLAGRISPSEAEAALSDVAEVCLEGAVRLAATQLAERRARLEIGDRIHFLIVGMGKLGTRELSYGSDLDLIFLFDVEHGDDADRLEAADYCVRLAQRLIGALQMNTAEGSCYEIDARLRPSGNQGTLVTSLEGFARYHAGGHGRSAEAWERQALLRSRAVAGDADLAERFEALRLEILSARPGEDLPEQIHRVRMRMEQELAKETASRRDFKTGRGGVLDVESIVQLRQLENAAASPELLAAVPLAVQLERLAACGALEGEQVDTLREGWRFFEALSNRLRIVENRSISELDRERGDLEGLALRMGYESSGREGGARRALLRDYARHTEAIRAVYSEVFGEVFGREAVGTERFDAEEAPP